MNKETLIKNRFWIMLGCVGLLVVTGWLYLLVAGSNAGEEQRKKFDTIKEAVKKNAQGTPKNPSWQQPWIEYGQSYSSQKLGVWEQAWKKQQGIYTWDKVSNKNAPLNKLEYYDDEVPETARKIYAQDLYTKQFDGLDKIVAPAEFKDGDAGFKQLMAPSAGEGGGAPSMEGGPGRRGKFSGMGMPPVSGGSQRPGGMPPIGGPLAGGPGAGGPSAAGGRSIADIWQQTPTMEEIWLAQEDFWVKREMLEIVGAALKEYSRFKREEISKDEPVPEKVVARHRFRNPSWEITLLIEDGKDSKNRPTAVISQRSTIKNISATKRTQLVANARSGGGLKFRLEQNGATKSLEISGEPLAYNASAPFKNAIPVDTIDLKKPCELEQVLEYETSPIRRIDDLRIAKNSHRLAFKALVRNDAISKDAPKDEDAGKDTTPAPGDNRPGGPGVPGGPGGPGLEPGGPGGPFGGMAATNATANGIERDRYLISNAQCRHLPIAMVLVVDQAAINDVLIAVVNSPLRIQVTQVHVLHVNDPGPQAATEGTIPGGEGPSPGMTLPGKPSPGGPGGPGKLIIPSGPYLPGGGGPGGIPGYPSTDTTATEDNNLFELTVYGVATLYERYPARQPKEKEATESPK